MMMMIFLPDTVFCPKQETIERETFQFSRRKWEISLQNLWHTKGVLLLTCPILLWQQENKRKMIYRPHRVNFFCEGERKKSHYFGMDDERPAAVNLIRNLF
jgi:hypothetical protein